MRYVFTDDGVRLAVSTSGNPGRTVLLIHAAGFCGECWRPVIELLVSKGHRAVWFDLRGHGGSGRSATPLSWWEMARDVAAVRATLDGPVMAVGHSVGGTLAMMAQLGDPDSFTHLVLAEPILVPGPSRREGHPLVEAARRRRRSFESPSAVREGLGLKPPFDTWNRTAFEGYVEGGFVETDEGVALACSPDTEIEIYTSSAAHGVLGRVREIRVPVKVMMGTASDAYPQEWAREYAGRFRRARFEEIPGGHLFPMENPRATYEGFAEYLG